ncbi:MFS general substrate transporter [Byssothecium circinans]|uniref:MFS general substrate transporter n=1 Tax=Byssothecium circinans TaxID=147558 RepID=A0A6A5TIU9_9PLEO|nr:MFS general substrate transporter [Byssothecium circinans]
MAPNQGNDGAGQQKGEMKDVKGKPNVVYPTGLKFAFLIVSIFSAMFLVSLDKLIISTAIPAITDAFNSKDDVGWYGTAYLLTNCSFQLVFGKVYKVFPLKITFMVSSLLFMVGSALCGAAPNSIAFILGRAIAGLGAGGILPGVMVIIVYAVPLQQRPKYQGWFGAIFGVASVLGPTVGGAFTTHVTWRWCFYINLPIGGVVMALVFFLLEVPDQPATKKPFMDRLRHLGLLGIFFLVPGIVCLCLVLQYGGNQYNWGNGRIIALFIISFLLLIAFCAVQVLMPEQAVLPPRVAFQRSIASGFWTSICVGAHQTIFLYYLPIWFQTVKGKSAVQSGVDLLAMVIPIAITAIVNGHLVSYIGYYTPSLILGVCVTAIGAGLLTTFDLYTSNGKWIGYQILYGFGQGLASQAPNMAAQTVLPKEEIAIGASLMFFGTTLFGTVFVSVGSNVFNSRLLRNLAGLPGITSQTIKDTGATDLINIVGQQYRTAALNGYNDALRVVFQVGLIMACIAFPGALAMEFRTVKKKGGPPKSADGAQVAEKGNAPGPAGGQAAPALGAQDAAAKEISASAPDVEKHQSRDTTLAESTKSSDAVNSATPNEGKQA